MGVSTSRLVLRSGFLRGPRGVLHAFRKLSNALPSRTAKLHAMHLEKTLVANLGSRSVPEADVIVAFPGAARKLFEKNKACLKVLHCVDAHPKEHNRALMQLTSRDRRAELYPKWLVRLIEREIAAADVLLVPSYLVAAQMKKHGVNPSKILVIPYGADASRFAGSGGLRPSTDGRVSLLYVGQISQRKNVGTLIDAAAESKVDLKLVGNVFDQRLVRQLPANVQLLGALGRNELARAYEQADAFVIASLEDACSLVALEAAVGGLPIIVTPENGAQEILTSSQKTLLDPRDVKSWADAFAQVKPLDAESRVRLSRVARQGIVSWTVYASFVRVELAKMARERVS